MEEGRAGRPPNPAIMVEAAVAGPPSRPRAMSMERMGRMERGAGAMAPWSLEPGLSLDGQGAQGRGAGGDGALRRSGGPPRVRSDGYDDLTKHRLPVRSSPTVPSPTKALDDSELVFKSLPLMQPISFYHLRQQQSAHVTAAADSASPEGQRPTKDAPQLQESVGDVFDILFKPGRWGAQTEEDAASARERATHYLTPQR